MRPGNLVTLVEPDARIQCFYFDSTGMCTGSRWMTNRDFPAMWLGTVVLPGAGNGAWWAELLLAGGKKIRVDYAEASREFEVVKTP